MSIIPFLSLKNDIKINYEFSKLNDDIPVVFVNGSIFSYKQWYPAFLPAFKKLTNNNRSYLLYDYEGVGLSSFKKEKFTIEGLIDELKQVLDLSNLDKVHLFGASKGTIVSQAFAGTYPERVASLSGYGVFNLYSNPEELANTKKEFSERLEAVQYFKDKFNDRMDKKTYTEVLKKVYTPLMFLKKYSELNLKEKIIFKIISRKIWPMFDHSPIGTMDLLFRYYVSDLETEIPYFEKILPKLKTINNVLWLNGSIDKSAPTALVGNLVELLPNSSLVIFENYGHIDPALSKKKAYNIMDSYVEFLNKIKEN